MKITHTPTRSTPTRRSALALGALAAASLAMGACATPSDAFYDERGADDGLPAPAASINHVVFFKLIDPSDYGELVADCDAMVRAIPGIVTYFRGDHIDTGRDTVDHDFSLGLTVGFMNEDAYLRYVDHPAHQALVAKWGPRLESILVRDVHDQRMHWSR